ncbi:hypothetical protein BO85DRAFT_437938 [Aspergillus piperis CBS 112811]|uniref:Clr5 domain-containing protein n=1 Tax=Aspergillus piperis CBS 112811 TaxID=1448313 RepID=A0A8G1VMF8_9EURO|nr:hypothetical protein BO85DRAFT_437938 [Aspergillus piperis CBS 112811]RAH58804.1 hypothetical protein BO85DRAFT_437938 [Aspergillus piperis CBS 112811]
MPKRAPRIPEEIWNRHKEEIIASYSSRTLDQMMKHMMEEHGFAARKNRFFDRPKEQKRRQEGKDSDVHIHTRAETDVEFGRPVHPGHKWCDSYITISTPQSEQIDLPSMGNAFLSRNLGTDLSRRYRTSYAMGFPAIYLFGKVSRN